MVFDYRIAPVGKKILWMKLAHASLTPVQQNFSIVAQRDEAPVRYETLAH
jgi:hypothetical protein